MKNVFAFSLAALLAAALAGCGSKPSVEASDKAAPTAAPSSTENAPPGTVLLGPGAPELKQMKIEVVKAIPLPADEVAAPARIEANPNRVGHAMLPAPGRIVRVSVKLGDAVQQGQPLLTLESPTVAEAETAFASSESAVRQAEIALAKADADLVRLTDLYQHQAVAQKEVLAASTALGLSKSALDQANSGRDQARRRLELLGLKAGKFQQVVTVNSPISGKVLDINAVEGEYRNEINAPVVTITDLSRVWATSEVPESKIRFCKVGGIASLELIAYPKEVFRARVTRIADTVNSETRSIKVSAELDNAGGRLRPDMFGQVTYADGTAPGLWVPEVSVVHIGGKEFVFVEQSTGRFVVTPVELGKSHDEGFAVLKGLKAGDRVVTQGSIYLKAAL